MADFNVTFELTAEQEAEAAHIEDVVLGAMRVEAKRIARLLASKGNRQLFGQTEFQLRDILRFRRLLLVYDRTRPRNP